MRAFPNQERFVKGNDCAISRRPLCFQMDTFPSSDLWLVNNQLFSVFNKETRYCCLKNDSVSLKQQLTHGPKIAYFPRNELAMNLLFVEVCRGCEEEEDDMKNSWLQCGRPAGYSETSWTWHYVLPTSANRYNFRTKGWQPRTPKQIFSFVEKIHKISVYSLSKENITQTVT